MNFDSCLAMDSVGSSSGIAMLWKEGLKVKITSYSKWHINALIAKGGGRPHWQFIGVYGHPDTVKRSIVGSFSRSLNPAPL